MNSETSPETAKFKAHIVWLLLKGRTEDALDQLAEHYKVGTPKIRVGLPKGHRKGILACYTGRNRTISVFNSDILMDPFTILHEFYHHIRIGLSRVHRGTERNANEFAGSYIESYNLMVALGSPDET
jgi:hypothetical protein